ncbi:hypothetical protein GGI20_006127, partial [Coemansia sp. BCRC 34301]
MSDSQDTPKTPTQPPRRGDSQSVHDSLVARHRGSVNHASSSYRASSHPSSIESTPQRGGKNGEFIDLEQIERRAYRQELTKELERECANTDKEAAFPGLMATLGLGRKYTEYMARPSAPFVTIVRALPAVSSVVPASRRNGNYEESDYVTCFKHVLDKLSANSATCPSAQLPVGTDISYRYKDCQNKSLESSSLKPDLVFYPGVDEITDLQEAHFILEAKRKMNRAEAYSSNLGQLADYALELKRLQPLRKFVPILFLYGCQLDLVVFTHGGYLKTRIGLVLHADESSRAANIAAISTTLQKLRFLLTLHTDEFGFLIRHYNLFKYVRLDSTMQPALLTPMEMPEGSTFTVRQRINRKVHITGRCTYLHRVNYGAKEA